MKTATRLGLLLCAIVSAFSSGGPARAQDAMSVRVGEAALAFAAGGIQKASPRDGIVNLITGDNQTSGNRMLLGRPDVFYLKLDHPQDTAVGDLYTIYRRVRKVFHPITREYLGFATIRLAVVRVVQVDPGLTTVETIRSYGSILPGDLVARFTPPAPVDDTAQATDVGEVAGMIIELQADRTMTLVSQFDVVYLDRGRENGLKAGDLLDIYRHSAGLPTRKIGQLKVLATEDRTAAAKILKANTRIMKGDRFKLAGYAGPLAQPVEPAATPASSGSVSTQAATATPTPLAPDVVSSKLKVHNAAGESRINLGDMANLLHYDSGEAAIKPESYKVLDQLIEYLRTSGDERLVRVEGHADNVEIGPSLKSRYPSNWELSKARASGVVRYLVEKGGLDSARLSSVGYGDSRPVATNTSEEGRFKNRRVEILLYAPPQESQPSSESPQRTQLPEQRPASLSARDAGDQPVQPDSDAAGTLSVGSDPGGAGSVTGSDADGKTSTDAVQDQPAPDAPPAQP